MKNKLFHVEYVAAKMYSFKVSVEAVINEYLNHVANWTFKPHGNGNGNWLLEMLADIDIKVGQKSHKNFVLMHYNRVRISAILAQKFEDDLNSGIILLPDDSSQI